MKKKYYQLVYQLDGRKCFIIWHTNDKDGVHVNAKGLITSFESNERIVSYAASHGFTIQEEEPCLLNLDWVAEWTLTTDEKTIICEEALAAWNMFNDIYGSLDVVDETYKKMEQSQSQIYEKLFWGNNLPSVTPVGEKYEPIWDKKEATALARVLIEGLKLFRNHIEKAA